MVTYNVLLDETKNGTQATLHGLRKGEATSRKINISMRSGSTPVQIPSGAIVLLHCHKPDNTESLISTTVDNNIIKAEITQQMCTVAGVVKCEVKVYNAAQTSVLYSAIFEMLVQEALSESGITSSNEFTALTEALESLGEAQTAWLAATATAESGETPAVDVTVGGSSVDFAFTLPKGDKGDPGVSVAVGTTTTGNAGTNASVANSGTESDPVLNFTIPKGDPGYGVPVGGTAGQVLRKINDTDYNAEWAAPYGGDVQSVDGVDHDAQGNVALGSVRYTAAQTLTDAQKAQALANIGAQASTPSVLLVAKSGGQYNTIAAAIAAARTYCTTANRVTILIGPGVWDEEIVLNPNPGIDFMGFGKYVTRIRHISESPSAPLYVSGTTTISGIGFTALTGSTGYACHLEAQTAGAVGGSIMICDCLFHSDGNCGVGVGMGGNWEVTFARCDMSAVGHTAVYCHNYPGTAANQSLAFIDCQFRVWNSTESVRIDDAAQIAGASTGSPMTLSFKGCYSPLPKIMYKYTSDATKPYLPRGEQITLLPESSTHILGVDYAATNRQIEGLFVVRDDGYFSILMERANEYNYALPSGVSKISEGENWVLFNTSDTNVRTAKIINLSLTATPK